MTAQGNQTPVGDRLRAIQSITDAALSRLDDRELLAGVNLTNAGDLREAMRSCMDARHTTPVVDMRETTFCDSAGLKQIVQASRRRWPQAVRYGS